MSITGAVDLANCMVDDGMLKDAITAFASLGTNMAHASNCERDLHRWLRDLFSFRLQSYSVDMFLQVTQLLLEIRCSPNDCFKVCRNISAIWGAVVEAFLWRSPKKGDGFLNVVFFLPAATV